MKKLAKLLSVTVESVEPLKGGLTNRCLKVIAKEGNYVWRPISQTSIKLGSDREAESHVLSQLKQYDVVPNIAEAHNEGLLIEWFEGETIASDLKQSQSICLDLLTYIHQLPISLFRPLFLERVMSYRERIQFYWSGLQPENQTAKMRQYLDYFLAQDDSPKFTPCLCHNDIGSHNIIMASSTNPHLFNKEKYGLIDWEFASIGDPSQELTMMIISNQFPEKEIIKKYCSVFQYDDNPWFDAIVYWRPWVYFLNVLWFTLGYQELNIQEYDEEAKHNLVQLQKIQPIEN